MTQQEIQIPQTEKLPVSSLKADGKNPNRMTKEQHERLATSIKKYGFIVPIITNKDLLIADGEQRWTVAKSLGMTQVSVIRLPVEEVDRRLLRQVLNKLKGEHELLLDAEEFEQIIKDGGKDDLQYLLSLSDGKLERYLMELHPPAEEAYEIPEIDKVQTEIKTGDILQLGQHKLMCGDSTNIEDINTLLENAEPIMMFTDPPYGVAFEKSELNSGMFEHSKEKKTGGFKNYGLLEGDKTIDTYLKFISTVAEKMRTKSWYLCCSDRHLAVVHDRLEQDNIYAKIHIIWVKEMWVPSWQHYHAQHEIIIYAGEGSKPHGGNSIWFGKNNESTVWQIQRDNTNQNKHPTQKPVPVVVRAIINSSRPSDGVVDFFCGSGTTLIACEQTQRVCYAMELEPRYCEIIAQRWEKYTGLKRQIINKSSANQEIVCQQESIPELQNVKSKMD